MELIIILAVILAITYVLARAADGIFNLFFGKLKFKHLSWLGIVCFSLVASVVLTDTILGSILLGNLEAVRFVFPVPGTTRRTMIERVLGGRERVNERNIYATKDFYREFGEEIEKKVDFLDDFNIHKLMNKALRIGSKFYRYHFYEARIENIPDFLLIKYPFLDSFYLPLFRFEGHHEITRFFPYLSFKDIQECQLPNNLYSVGLLYELNASARYQKEQKLRINISMLLVPLLFIIIVLLLRRKYIVKSQPEPVKASASVLAHFIQIFVSLFPLLLLIEIVQPTCYRPGSGRLLYKQKPEMKVVAEEILDVYSKEGKIDSEIHDLMKKAIENPSTLIEKE